MATGGILLVVVFVALCFLAVTIGLMILIFRAATRPSGRSQNLPQREDSSNAFVPPVIGDDSLTNPANPLYHHHHPSSSSHDSGHSHSHSDSTSSSFSDSGSSSSASFDSGSSSVSSDSGGSGCG